MLQLHTNIPFVSGTDVHCSLCPSKNSVVTKEACAFLGLICHSLCKPVSSSIDVMLQMRLYCSGQAGGVVAHNNAFREFFFLYWSKYAYMERFLR
jgi:hypothetical protein